MTLTPMIEEITKELPVLCALVIANIAAGTLQSVTIEKIAFDWKKMVAGILKAIVAVVSCYALAFAFDMVDLSGLGFTPMTIVSTGVIVYACKLGANLIKLFGLSDFIKLKSPLDAVNQENGTAGEQQHTEESGAKPAEESEKK